MKRWMTLLFVLILLFTSAKGETILLSADLHYGDHALESDAILDALLSEATRADALILLGDSTNNAHQAEFAVLLEKLSAAKEKGAHIFVLPGNHDLTRQNYDEFSTTFASFGYNQAFSKDEETLSYAVKLTEKIWLVMLDTCDPGAANGLFRASTALWLDAVLQKADAQGAFVLAAGHHPLLPHTYNDQTRGDVTQNGAALAQLLRAHGVPLYVAGHRHIAHRTTENGLTEILIGTPTQFPNKIGELCVQNGSLTYQTRVLPVAVEGFAQASQQEMRAQAEKMAQGALKNTAFAQDEAMVALFQNVYSDYKNGTLFLTREAYLADPAFERWQDESIASIFRPWMRYLLENMTEDMNRWSK